MDQLNADFAQRVVIETGSLPWIASPQAGVERRMLDRIGGEVARATSLVRYAPQSHFPAHDHALGEEFLVLEGVFSDEHGDYPKGTYVRNPPGSRHTPRTAPGCVILVKLRQMRMEETRRVVVDTASARWQPGELPGLSLLPLFAEDGREVVRLERLAAGSTLDMNRAPSGEELFLLEGDLKCGNRQHGPGTWMRMPGQALTHLGTLQGALYWVKRGHLPRSA